MVGILAAVRHARAGAEDQPGRPGPRAFHAVVLVGFAARCGCHGVLRRAVRCADAAAARRLPRHRDTRLRRDRADRRAQHAERHQRRRRPERGTGADAVRLQFHRAGDALLLCRAGAGRVADVRERAAARLARGSRLDGGARGRDGGQRDGGRSHAQQAAGFCHRRRLRRRRRRVLRRQAANRDAGHVRLSGFGDDPGHGGARRHGQCLGRRRRRGAAEPAAILVPARPDRLAARAGRLGRQCVDATG